MEGSVVEAKPETGNWQGRESKVKGTGELRELVRI